MPNNSFVWLPLSCHDGLVYDKNLRSCVIPEFEWDCLNKNERTQISGDDANIYEVDNLEIYEDRLAQQTERSEEAPEIFDENFMEKSGDDEFIEVIDGQEEFRPIDQRQIARIVEMNSSGDESDEVNYSGDGFTDFTTPSSVAITTHLQRLTQLMEKVWQNSESESTAEPELTPADLNRFLAQETIQMETTKNFNDDTKTPMPANGKIHPEIMNEVLKKQQKIHKDALKLVTIPMDQTTPTMSKNNFLFMGQDSMTDIELKSGANPNHQIVVNRPEGSVLFNVPIQEKTKENLPVLSEEVLRTVLEISKQLASQRHPTKDVYIPHNYVQPIYYPYPIPMNTGGSNYAATNNSKSENHEKVKTKGNLKDKESWYDLESHGNQRPNGDYMGISYQSFPGNRFGNLKGNKNSGNPKRPNSEADDSYEDQFPYNPTYYQNFHQSSPIYYNRVNQPQNYQDRYGSLSESSSAAKIRHGSLKNKVKIDNRHDLVADNFNNRKPSSEDYYPFQRPNNNNNKFTKIYRNPYRPKENHHMQHSYHHLNNDEEEYDSEDEENRPVVIQSSAHYLEHANKRQKIRNKNKPLKESISFESNFKKKNDFAAYSDDDMDDSVEGEAEESYDDSNGDKLVSLGGHYYNIDSFKASILPLLKNEDKVDVLECSVGTRQPNATDCKRYYVCNPSTKVVTSYTCPTFTAFNEKSRMCDAKAYSTCKTQQESKNSIIENRWIHMETLKALAQAKAEAQKAQKIANMLRRQQQPVIKDPVYEYENEEVLEDEEESEIPIFIPSSTTTTTSTTKPPRRKSPSTSSKQKKKKRAKCREPGKFYDPNSKENYYLCFLDQQSNKLKRKKIPCASGLIFCRESKFCTLQTKCNRM